MEKRIAIFLFLVQSFELSYSISICYNFRIIYPINDYIL